MARPPTFTGPELARIRVSLGLSVDQVAWLASVSNWQVRHAEGTDAAAIGLPYRPTLEVLALICAGLHFEIMRRIKNGEGLPPERRRRTTGGK